ncbi:MAG: hypothetical protein RIR96_1076 [Bacteroidota bacterium]
MKKIIFGAILLALFSTSCKKDDQNRDGTPAAGSYINQTAGTTWNFKSTDSSALTSTNYTVTSSTRDTNVNGRVYHIFNNSNGGNQYLNVSGSDYYQYSSLGAGLPAFELRYLSDNATVGSSWTNPLSATTTLNGTSVTINATVKTSVEQKGGSLTINGKNYTNVITMRTEIQNATVQVSFFNLPVNFTTQNVVQYYAPKYGLIKRSANLVANITVPGNPPTTQEIINTYTVDELMSSSIQ